MRVMEELIASPETKGIFWYPMDFNAGEPFIQQAKAKGIPFVIGAADSPFKTRDAFIGVNDEIFGVQAGAWAAELIGCQGKVGTMALVQQNTDARIAAFTEYIKNTCPDVAHAERVSHDGSVASATSTLDAYLVAHPDMSLLYFADGSGGQQAQNWSEKQAQGLETMFLATDSPPLTLQGVKDGIFIGTVAQNTYVEAYWGVMLLDALARGVKVPDTIYLGVDRISADNVDEFLPEE
jgi:ABC-type sugar transport system substrate-binding protein